MIEFVSQIFVFSYRSLFVADPLDGAEALQVAIIVLKVDAKQELHHDEGQVDPERVRPFERVLRVSLAENPDQEAGCRGNCYQQVDHIDVL